MKILLALITLTIIILTGCGVETRTLNNMTYQSKVEGKDDTLVIFTQPNGVRRNLYWNPAEPVILVEGRKYDIEFTVEDKFYDGDCIVSIEFSKEEDK